MFFAHVLIELFLRGKGHITHFALVLTFLLGFFLHSFTSHNFPYEY
jgi:hypothetical protein